MNKLVKAIKENPEKAVTAVVVGALALSAVGSLLYGTSQVIYAVKK